jgi:hypothetical protein
MAPTEPIEWAIESTLTQSETLANRQPTYLRTA